MAAELIFPFNIDNDELSGMTPQQCFVLGFELAQTMYELQQPGPIHKPVHSGNQERLARACQKAGRTYELTWMKNDLAEDWMLLHVPPRQPEVN